MAYFLKSETKGLYLKGIDTKNEKIEFTEHLEQAKKYDGDWYATTELEYAQFHFPQEEETLKHMQCVYE
jgi:hypothetical protein